MGVQHVSLETFVKWCMTVRFSVVLDITPPPLSLSRLAHRQTRRFIITIVFIVILPTFHPRSLALSSGWAPCIALPPPKTVRATSQQWASSS